MKTNQIATIWTQLKGNKQNKAIALCEALNLEYTRLPRAEYKKNGKEKQGDTDGLVVRTRAIKDEFDLFTLFHEIGHTQLHWNGQDNPVGFIFDTDRIESEANKFAADVMFAIFGSKIENTVRICMI
jgi:Zn-dependent peptidase ImmA (M78 family)